MAKKRRKPRPRRNPSPSGASTKTAARPGGSPSGRSAPAGRPPASTTPGSSEASRQRAARKEMARAEREAARKRIARQGMLRRAVWGGVIGVVIVAGVLYFTRETSPPTRPGELPGELRTEAPWPANGEQAQARSDDIGLPPEGSATHIHANLRIFVHGEGITVPTDVGIDRSSNPPFVASLHTHEASGTIHMESASTTWTFTLGQFFDIWGVRLSPKCMGAYCNDPQNTLQVFVGGQEVTGNIRDVELADQAVIVVTYGTADELPSPIPSTFDFSSVPQ